MRRPRIVIGISREIGSVNKVSDNQHWYAHHGENGGKGGIFECRRRNKPHAAWHKAEPAQTQPRTKRRSHALAALEFEPDGEDVTDNRTKHRHRNEFIRLRL